MFSKRIRKEHEELKDKYDDLEDKYEELQGEHDRLRKETGEHTHMRISYIEEEIESMNERVEKLARDSYEIHGEVREIRDSVTQMHTALKDIVVLYKAILSKYGVGDLKAAGAAPPRPSPRARPARGGEPGDHIIDALKRERRGQDEGGKATPAPKGTGGPTPRPPPPSASPPAPPPPEARSSAIDELHRLSSEQQRRQDPDGEDLAKRLADRSGRDDRVDRVARRDMGRASAIDRTSESEFTRSLPQKRPLERRPHDDGPGRGEWEALESHPGEGRKGERRKRVKLEDLLEVG